MTRSKKDQLVQVLVCDDERHIVRLLQINLEKEGWQVYTAFTAREAIEMLNTTRLDMVVIDASLPENGTEEVLRTIRDTPDFQGIKVIRMGIEDDSDDDAPGSFIKRPFNSLDIFRSK